MTPAVLAESAHQVSWTSNVYVTLPQGKLTLGVPMTLLLAFFLFLMSYYDNKAGSPVLLVDLVTKAHGVDNGELEPYVALLELVGVGLELDPRLVVLSGLALELGVEQCIHEGGLPQPGLPFRNTVGKQGSWALVRCMLYKSDSGVRLASTSTTLLTYVLGGLTVYLLQISGIHAFHLEFKSKIRPHLTSLQ